MARDQGDRAGSSGVARGQDCWGHGAAAERGVQLAVPAVRLCGVEVVEGEGGASGGGRALSPAPGSSAAHRRAGCPAAADGAQARGRCGAAGAGCGVEGGGRGARGRGGPPRPAAAHYIRLSRSRPRGVTISPLCLFFYFLKFTPVYSHLSVFVGVRHFVPRPPCLTHHFQGTQAPSMDPPPGRGGVTGRPVHAWCPSSWE